MLSKYLITASALLAASANGYHSDDVGITGSVSLDVIEQAKNIYIWTVLDALESVHIPDIDYNHGRYHMNMKENSLFVEELIYDISFLWQPQVNGFTIVGQRFKFIFYSCNFHYKGPIPPTPHGEICGDDDDDDACEWEEINHQCPKTETGEYIFPDGSEENVSAHGGFRVCMNTINIADGMKFSIKTLEDGRVVPVAEPYNVIVDINKNDLTFDIWGSCTSALAQAFKLFFKNKIVGYIELAVEEIFTTIIPGAINGFFEHSDSISNLPGADWALDWEMPQGLQFTKHGLEAGAKGLFFDKAAGEVPPAVAVPDLPTFIGSIDSGVQVYISNWTMDSFTASYLSASSLEGWVNSGLTGITCGMLEIAMPGISKHYGASQPVDIFFDVISLTDFGVNSKKEILTLDGEVMLKFQVHTKEGTTEIAAQLTLQAIDIEGGLQTHRMNIVPQLKTANVGKVVVDSCAFGRLSGFTLKVEINNGIRLAKPMINKILNDHPISLPDSLFNKRITLSELSINYHDDFIGLGITPRFHTLHEALGTSVLITEDDLAFLQ